MTDKNRFFPRIAAGLAAGLVTTFVHAASLTIVPLAPVDAVAPGDVLNFDIFMDFSDDPVVSGGFDLHFDEDQLQLVSFTEEVFLGDPDFGRPPTYVPGSGQLESWGVASFSGLFTGHIGSVSFRVLEGAGTSVIALGPTSGLAGPWISAVHFGCCIDVDYGQVTVSAVPLPAAGLLMLAALAGLWPVARARAHADPPSRG